MMRKHNKDISNMSKENVIISKEDIKPFIEKSDLFLSILSNFKPDQDSESDDEFENINDDIYNRIISSINKIEYKPYDYKVINNKYYDYSNALKLHNYLNFLRFWGVKSLPEKLIEFVVNGKFVFGFQLFIYLNN